MWEGRRYIINNWRSFFGRARNLSVFSAPPKSVCILNGLTGSKFRKDCIFTRVRRLLEGRHLEYIASMFSICTLAGGNFRIKRTGRFNFRLPLKLARVVGREERQGELTRAIRGPNFRMLRSHLASAKRQSRNAAGLSNFRAHRAKFPGPFTCLRNTSELIRLHRGFTIPFRSDCVNCPNFA